jgi:hypothetical protein
VITIATDVDAYLVANPYSAVIALINNTNTVSV